MVHALAWARELSAFADEETLELESRDTIPADVVIFATGWNQPTDFLSPDLRELVRDDDGIFTPYRHILPPGAPGNGFIVHASSIAIILMSETCAHWLVAAFQDALELPGRGSMLTAEIDKMRAWSAVVFPRSGGVI